MTVLETPNRSAPEAAAPTPPAQAPQGNLPRATWGLSMQHLRANTSHCREEVQEALRDLFLFAIRFNLSRREVAAEVGIADNTLYKVMTGRYVDDQSGERRDLSDNQLTAIRRWLDVKRAHAAKRSEFVMTATAAKVQKAYEFARESRTPVFLYGPSHIGKTWALEHISEQNNHGRTPYIRLQAASNIKGLLGQLASAVGVSASSNSTKLRGYVMDAIGPDQVLLFDEFHLLLETYHDAAFAACVELVRDIHDTCRCGMVLSLTNFGRDRLAEKRQGLIEQTFRRGVHRFQLPKRPQKADLEPILQTYGLEFPARDYRVTIQSASGSVGEIPHEMLRQIGERSGLKAITERLRYARKLAVRRKAEDPSWEDFVAAHCIIERNALEEDDWS